MIGTKFSRLKLFMIVVSLIVSIEVIGFIYYFLYLDNLVTSRPSVMNDLSDICRITFHRKIRVYILDKELLLNANRSWQEEWFPDSLLSTPILLGVDERMARNWSDQIRHHYFRDSGFKVISFYKTAFNKMHNVIVAYILQRYYTFHVIVLHTLEDNTWWFGNVFDDPKANFKLHFLGLSRNKITVNFEGILNKFESRTQPLVPNFGIDVLIPQNVKEFLDDFSNSVFIECNYTRADNFRNTHQPINDLQTQRFKHRAWKLLADTKTILDKLSVKFWLSSGTCLGYFRECDIISYSNDVDIGIFAKDYNDAIISEMEFHGLALKHWFGLKEDSLELSFITSHKLKLDIFFFYEDDNTYWNGGTQARTGLKFKYIFPKFDLCWTMFKHLKVRVPCDTERYIIANYGPDWFKPVTAWDWKTSPFNVIPNGRWSKEVLPEAVRIF